MKSLILAALFTGAAVHADPGTINPPGSLRVPAKVYLPAHYNSLLEWPLIIQLHGFGSNAAKIDRFFGLSPHVTARGFILISPEGTPTPAGTVTDDGEDLSGMQFWNAMDACCDVAETKVDDVGYLNQIIETAKSTYHVDTSRIYVVGHSNGGFMANRLACEIGERLAAVVNLAGGTYKLIAKCRDPRPLAFLHIHAEDDAVVSYHGKKSYAGGTESADQWAARNTCSGAPTAGKSWDFINKVPGLETHAKVWADCASGTAVELWTISAFKSKEHNPHVPLLNANFTEAMLEFLFAHAADKRTR